MDEATLHQGLVWAVFAAAPLALGILVYISAPYGRHGREGWGPTISARGAWLVMETPAVVLFGVVYALGSAAVEPVPLLLLGLWMLHYVHRAWIYPLRIRSAGRPTPILIAVLGCTFVSVNAYTNARWLTHFGDYSSVSLTDGRVVLGTVLFLAGWAVNMHADTVLIGLRKPGETDYKVPEGGLYRWVSCPNYLGEIVAWSAWALVGGSAAALAFAVFTAANLVPRARTHHAWYRDTFPEYPPQRRALLPLLW